MKIRWFPVWAASGVLLVAAVSLAAWDEKDIVDSSLALVAAATGVLYTMLAGRGRISCYVFGFVNAPIYAYLSWRWGYYGDMSLNLYYFVMMFFGLALWRRNRSATDAGAIVRTRLSWRGRCGYTAVIVGATSVLWALLAAVGGNRPFCDAVTNVFSVIAIVLTVKRCIEQWVLWLAVDLIEMFMWWRTGESSLAILAMWALFLVDGCYCYRLWLSSAGEYGKISA